MKQEQRLFDLIGKLPDEVLSQTDAPQTKRRTPKSRRWIGVAVAACLLVAVGVWGMTTYHPSTYVPRQTVDIGTIEHGPELNWPKVSEGLTLADLRVSMLPVGDRVAEYHQVENPNAIPEKQRPRYLGEPYRDLENWYLPEGSTILRYLIHEEEDGSYTLWEFSCFEVIDQATLDQMKLAMEQGNSTLWAELDWFCLDMDFSPYPYSEVLETIYGISSAEDLVSVAVNPATMDNTDAGKQLQKEIGTHTVWKRASLDALYDVLTGMTCCGANHWELIDRGGTDEEGGLLNSVRLGRYLTIETAGGATIDTLKYSAAGGQFYEYYGIAYEPLDAETAAQMNDIFNIAP